MTGVGTRISRILAVIMTLGLVLVGIGMLAGVAMIVAGLIDPAIFDDVRGRLNGRPVYLRDPSQAVAMGSIVVLFCGLAGIALWQLLGMLRSAAAGAPFTIANVRRLQVLAGVFAAVLLVQLFAFVLPGPMYDLLNLRKNGIDSGSLLSALFALVLAEVFREGVRLREDVEGTI